MVLTLDLKLCIINGITPKSMFVKKLHNGWLHIEINRKCQAKTWIEASCESHKSLNFCNGVVRYADLHRMSDWHSNDQLVSKINAFQNWKESLLHTFRTDSIKMSLQFSFLYFGLVALEGSTFYRNLHPTTGKFSCIDLPLVHPSYITYILIGVLSTRKSYLRM